VVDLLGAPSVLVNNAGVLPTMNRAHEISHDQYDNVLSVNLGGVFRMSRAVVVGDRGP
jgi:NAD(P)-dependent dehydrogenase (short-subunit alcohol dehydrogenase family)